MSLNITHSIIMSHHNYIVASHIIMLLSRNGYAMNKENFTNKELNRAIEQLSPSHVILSKKNYLKHQYSSSSSISSDLIVIQLQSDKTNDFSQIDIPFLNYELTSLMK